MPTRQIGEDPTCDLIMQSNESPVPKHSMPPNPSFSARPAAAFFSRALSSFQSSGSTIQVICTAAPALHHKNHDHGHPTPLPPRFPPQSLVVLDSSFNPPTRAHLRMATSAIQELMHKQSQRPGALRLLLLLSINNADKDAKPAAFDKRLAMMWAFAGDVQRSLQADPGEEQASSEVEPLSVDLGLSTAPYFYEKSAALAEGGFYNGERGMGGSTETEQVFLVGYDALVRIFDPKYYGSFDPEDQVSTAGTPPIRKALDPFFNRAKLRVTMRTGDEWGEADEQAAYVDDLLHAGGLSDIGGSTNWGSRIHMTEGRKPGEDVISSTYVRAAVKAGDSEQLNLMVTPEVRWWIEQESLYTE
ncbi:uncharacterized protein B0H64DRAFT_393765 [Chaetomium fimeti]|uniref:Nicotinamide-nucleotide adenylyltransferase n=1 Tax=Chaetomium fimeti TaxID=1854472 RepID=A0AAE0LV74_9PEZI|nr:hypothetical protein B0H64DRAFT_393765 [Chaetomium fimeti]